jgi:DNA helicase HerA-like ATPase
MLEDIFVYLKQGKTVIVDLSLKDSYDANVLSAVLIRNLFENNKMYHTAQNDAKVIDTVICVEEAQNVISEEFVRSNANPFVRMAKEGRKFKLGMIAITQRPSAIAEEIRSQAENFFTFYMGNTDDIKSLVRSNINYDGVISRFIQNETIPGNLYMVSAKQSFALPVRVLEFEKLVADKIYK